MDDRRFDELSRRLAAATTRRGGMKAALGALLGGAAGAAALEAEAKRRRHGGQDAEAERKKRKKKCKPACADGQSCVKGACVCDNGGTACGANCCAIGQRCEGGQCVSDPGPGPEPDACIAAGEPCKATGRRCCDGRVCASGQGGEADVACYVPKTGACASTADCVYGMSCRGGICSRPDDAEGLGTPCSSASQQACSHPGAVCTPYTGAGAPNGAFCTLPLQRSCSGDPECTCYKCWYSNVTPAGTSRSGRASANTRACCHVPGQGCGSDGDCCLGLTCVNGTCGGTMCVPDDADGCDAATPCCNPAATCTNGTCTTCGPATCPNGCCRDGVCQPGDVAGACGTGGLACAVCTGSTGICHNRTCQACNGTTCPNGCCQNGVCEPGNTASACGNNGAACTQCAGTPAFCHSGTCSQCAATFEPTNDPAANGTKLQAEWNKRKTDSTLGEIVLGAGSYLLNPVGGYGLYWNEPATEAIAVKACANETVTIVPSNRTVALVAIPDGKVTLTGLTLDGQSMTTQVISAGTNSDSIFDITLNQCIIRKATQGLYAVGKANVSKLTINGGTYCPDAMAAILTPTCTGSPVIGSCTAILGGSFPSGCGCGGTCPV